jgi:perosamine synthetase
MIPISAVAIDEEAEQLVLEVLRSGRLAQGPMVERFEGAFAAICGVGHAVAVANGTVSLVASLQALEIGPGDEVVTSPFTFVATLNAILEAGATVRFADIDPSTFTVHPDPVRGALTPATRAIMPVHLYGQPADMVAMAALADEHGLAIVEDAAQAHGAAVGGRPVGSYGLGSFSFYATKNITTGEGGIVTTDDDGLADRLRLLRNQGMRARYQYELAGHNYRMTELQAAIGIPQLGRIDALVAQRQHNARTLTEGLAEIDGLVVPRVAAGRTHVWHQYTVRITDGARLTRDAFVAGLTERGVGCGVYYPRLVFDYDCYRAQLGDDLPPFPHAEQAAREVVSLPVHPLLDDAQLAEVIGHVRALLT